MRAVLHGIPWALPGLIATAVLIVHLHGRPPILPGVPRAIVAIWIFALGLIASATLTPGSDAPFPEARPCEVTPVDVLSLRELLTPSEASLNVVLFVPLGVAAVLAPRMLLAVISVAAAAALPFAIELTQRALPVLGRGCQTADVVDNLTGLAIGSGIGVAVVLVRRGTGAWRVPSDPPD